MKKRVILCWRNITPMQTIAAGQYAIYFTEEGYLALNDLVAQKKYSKVFLFVDSNTNEFCMPYFMSVLATDSPVEIIEIDPGEKIKSIITCTELWELLTEMGADRKSVIINLGGGVVTDIGGFVASTYMRGIDFINIPTTLLGMVDAAIGGKTGIDLGALKNQVGTITPPAMVVIDPLFLETLPKRELRSGLAEMLKHGLIADRNYWGALQDLEKVERQALDQLIYQSIIIKNNIVTSDLTENGMRKSLNFGHTLGHAIESHFLQSTQPLTHGEAIALGMIAESYLSMRKLNLPAADYLTIKQTILNYFPVVVLTEQDLQSILKLMVHDKKNEYGHIRFCLLQNIGACVIDQEVDNDLIMSAFEDYGRG